MLARCLAALAALAVFAYVSVTAAQSWPTQPLKVIRRGRSSCASSIA